MKIRNIFETIPLVGLVLAGCESTIPDVGSNIALRCNADPKAVVTEIYDLIPNQVLKLGNRWIKVISPGMISFDVGRDSNYNILQIKGLDYFVAGSEPYNGKLYKVNEEVLPDSKTRLTIVHNCADPKNP